MITATQAALTGPETFELRDADLSPEAGEVVVAIEVCGICSSEIPSFENGPEIDNAPQFLGHEPSGTIAAVGHGVTEFREGDRVTGAFSGAFATHAVANAEKLIAVPDNVTLKYALGEPLFCITNIARAATPQFGDHVAVVGCGAMGLLTISALCQPGLSTLLAVDQISSRLDVARDFGATETTGNAGDPTDQVMDLTRGGCDVVVELTGHPGGLELATNLLRPGQGKLVMAGFHHSPDIYNLRNFALKGLIAHQAHPNYSPDQQADYARAMTALSRGVFPMDRLITHEYSLEDIGTGFNALRAHEPGFLKGVVVPIGA